MAGAEPEPGSGGGSGSALPGQSHSAVPVAPLDPEQLRRVLEQVTRAQPPPFVLQDAAQRLRDAAQQAALQRGPGAGAPRLLPPQQLEAICFKVTAGDTKRKERPMPPLATIQPKTARQSQLPRGSSSLGLCASSPQLLRVHALARTGSQLRFLRGFPQPPAPRVLVQKPLPALQPVPWRRVKAPQAAHGHGVTLSPLAASDPPAVAPVSSSSAHLLISSLHAAHTEKLKKSLKVKTRSGRISRPPKYKARDYKFIKTEDLADGHLSDSDDYSELSVDEEEEEREKPGRFDIEGCALRPKAFKCQTCEKSYIGKGGLARHFKLNPGHGQLEPEMLQSEKANGSLTLGCIDSKTRGLASLTPPTPAVLCMEEAEAARHVLQNGQPAEVEETLVPESESRSPSALLRPEKYLEPRNGSWASQAESSTANLQQSGAVPPNSNPAVPSGLSISREARLREALKQCGREELVELVLPQLAQVVTLYELLVVKVERSPAAKPVFPAVYKEFEELYDVVKRMCQDYLSSSGLCSQEPLEINNDEVARSLGITEFLRKKEAHPSSAPECSSPKLEGKLEEASGQKREREQGEGLATVKKARTAALSTDVPGCPAAISGCQQKPGSSCAPATSKGSAPVAIEKSSPCSEGSCGEMAPASDGSGSPVGQQLSVMPSADFEARSGSADPALLCQDVSRSAFYSQVAEPRELPPAQLSVFSEENAPEHTVEQDSRAIQKSSGVCGNPSSGGGVESLLLGESGNGEAGDFRERSPPHLSGQQASPSHALPAEAAAFPLQNILPVNVLPAACVFKTVPKPEPHSGPDGSLSTSGGPSVGSKAGDVSRFLSRMEAVGQREPETVAAVGETLAFEISDVCQEVLSQGQEQIFIRTSNGLILSHPSTIQVSQEENAVIETNAGASVLRFDPPEGVALEAMEAFHTVEAEPSQ
ncbi:zinc finger protein 839 [Peromyscus eremicus]|uniref:zinc finger protein 839 n=1 Tax=Peromyscus eremicus TaxID=42410 RepID=UPI0027DCB5F9|nr:zinc finger protein 839 [Peromyscus eremicus]